MRVNILYIDKLLYPFQDWCRSLNHNEIAIDFTPLRRANAIGQYNGLDCQKYQCIQDLAVQRLSK